MNQSPNSPVVVFDCMIFLQAVANDASPTIRLLELVDAGEITLCVSEQILRELRKVLDRPEVRTALPGINDLRVESLFRRLEKQAIMVQKVPRVFEYARDPGGRTLYQSGHCCAREFPGQPGQGPVRSDERS
jgi:putative PIN family toxin of toxin-antitoxin system